MTAVVWDFCVGCEEIWPLHLTACQFYKYHIKTTRCRGRWSWRIATTHRYGSVLRTLCASHEKGLFFRHMANMRRTSTRTRASSLTSILVLGNMANMRAERLISLCICLFDSLTFILQEFLLPPQFQAPMAGQKASSHLELIQRHPFSNFLNQRLLQKLFAGQTPRLLFIC